jgi:ATP-dependent HslUV protease ATP-binding subunit HslU
MVFFLPESAGTQALDELTPRQIVEELDKYVIGQKAAKRAVAIALRNRMRRLKLPPELADEVAPKNIIMIGPTGVGKTEIARRLARLSNSPLIKVEASKFTEVGYVGRDVESMVRDLVELSVDMVREEKIYEIQEKAEENAEERLLDLLLPRIKPVYHPTATTAASTTATTMPGQPPSGTPTTPPTDSQATREKLRSQLRDGKLDERTVEIDVRERMFPSFEIITSGGIEEMDINIKDMLPGLFGGGKTRKRKMKVPEALEYLIQEEEQKLVDMEQVSRLALERAEQAGIIFIDELDKVAGREGGHGPEVSREGVQRDLLPIVEGTSVSTKYGMVRTSHILFIAAGAFHVSKPSDLIPELQGRFPIRVELDSLDKDDFIRILREPKNALLKQYRALLATEGIDLDFTDDAVEAVATYSMMVNERTENIGARRLHTIMERVLDELSFEAPDLTQKKWVIDAEYVNKMLDEIAKDDDLSQYIL